MMHVSVCCGSGANACTEDLWHRTGKGIKPNTDCSSTRWARRVSARCLDSAQMSNGHLSWVDTKLSTGEKGGSSISNIRLGSACHTAGLQIPAEWQPCDAGE